MIWRAGGAGFRAGAQAAISVQSPDSGSTHGSIISIGSSGIVGGHIRFWS